MVDLPRGPRTLVTSETPKSSLTAADIAAPSKVIAGAMKEGSEAFVDIAKPLAERAGYEAVTRDAEGNLKVDRVPIVGPAGEHYEKAIQWSALAKTTAEARQKNLELARDFPNDPDGYLKAVKLFKDDYVEKVRGSAGPEVAMKLGAVIDSTTTQQYNSLLSQHQATITRNFDRDTSATIRDAKVDLDNLIETGGLDTPAGRKEINRLIGTVTGTYRARVSNPILAAPPGATEAEIKKFDTDLGGAMFASQVKKTLQDNPDDGVSKAEALIDANFKDESIPASQRVANRDRGQEAIKTFTQDRVRAASVAVKQQHAIDDAYLDSVIQSTATGGHVITENDIKRASDVSPAAKIKALAFIKREGMPEPLARVSHETTMNLMRRMRATDDTRLTSDDEIHKQYDAGNLSRTDFNFLRNEYTSLKTPEGESMGRERSEFFKRYAPALDAGMNGPQHSALGAQRVYEFEMTARRREADLRKKGLDPHLAYDPSSEHFLGRPEVISKNRASLIDIQNYDKEVVKADKEREKNRNLTGPGKGVISTTTIQDIPAGMSPAEAMKLFKPGTKIRLPDGRLGTVP